MVFDCDGVLVDTEPPANRVLQEALAALGLALPIDEVHRRYVGLPMDAVVERIEAELGRALPDGWLDRLQRETFARFRRDGVRAIPGAPEAVAAVQARGIPTCVASSGEHEKMRLTLGATGLLDRFAGRIFSATDVPRGKPHPDLFLHAAARMGADPARTVVVEDSVPGVRAAVAAGMRALGYAPDAPDASDADDAHGADALAAAGAEVFRDMRTLPELL